SELDALGILVAHLAGALHGDAVVGLDRAWLDAEFLGVSQQARDIRGMEQGLRGNAADVDAYAPELVLLDERGAHAELRSPNGADVARGTPTQDDHVKLIRHRYSSIADCGFRIAESRGPDRGPANPQSAIANPQSQQHRQRVLQDLFERLEERRPRRAVDHPVVAAHRDPHAAPRRELTVHDHRLLAARGVD